MKQRLYLLLLLATCSCATSEPVGLVRYTPRNGPPAARPSCYTLRLPKGYQLLTLIGGHHELEQQFVYPDSARVYISDFTPGSTVNYDHIVAQGAAVAAKRFESQALQASINAELGLPFRSDTMVLAGITKNGRHWKDIRLGTISIGYSNVRPDQQVRFDQVLASVGRCCWAGRKRL